MPVSHRARARQATLQSRQPETSEDPSDTHPAFQDSRCGGQARSRQRVQVTTLSAPFRYSSSAPRGVTKVSPKPTAVTALPSVPPQHRAMCGSRRPGSTLSPEKQDLHFIRLTQAGILPIQTLAGHCPPLADHPHFRPLQHTGATYACPPEHKESQTWPESAAQTRRGGLASYIPSVLSFPMMPFTTLLRDESPREGVCVQIKTIITTRCL